MPAAVYLFSPAIQLMTMWFGLTTFSTITLLAITAPGALAQDFVDIDDVPQDIAEVSLPPYCPRTGRVPNTMFTFQVADNATSVSSFPADLVVVGEDGDRLTLDWNEGVAYSADEGGVKISLPADQLTKVSVAASSRAQILDGFTSVTELEVSSSAKLWATFTTLDSTSFKLRVTSSADAQVISNQLVTSLTVTSSANCLLEAPEVETLDVSSSADLTMKGDVQSGVITSSADVNIDGMVTGDLEVTSSADLKCGEITGSVDVNSSGDVTAPSCDAVTTSSSGSCSTGNPNSVTVTIDEQFMTRRGTSRCSRGSSGGVATMQPKVWMKSIVVALASAALQYMA